MKSIKIFAAAGAIALLGMAGLSSCKPNNEPETPGKYNGETVKTDLFIKIADKVSNSDGILRMPGTIVQKDGNFRGMDDIVLIPLKEESSSFVRNGSSNISLAPGINSDGLLNTSNAAIYPNVAVPVGTKKFRFYGKATDVANSNDTIKYHNNGVVVCNNLTNANANAVTFDLKPIYSTTGTPTKATKLAEYVTSIANAKSAANNPWSTYGGSAGDVYDYYVKFTGLKAGSSNAILTAVTDLYNTMERFYDDKSNTPEQDATLQAVMTAILAHTDITTATESAKYAHVLVWQTDEDGSLNLLGNTLGGYPEEISLPEGAAMISWVDGTPGSFAVQTTMTFGDMTMGTLNQFTYPASLQYYAESTIRTATYSQADLYNNTNTWDQIIAGYDATIGHGVEVTSSTKSVAIYDPINYGVGQLRVVVSRKNEAFAQNVEDKTFSTAETENLKWKGVLVGGQKQVNYQFEQVTPAPATSYTIYDNYMHGKTAINQLVTIPLKDGNPRSVENYTLVFSSAANSGKTDKVYIALEMVNEMAPFYGMNDQLIPLNGTFYLIGELQVKDGTKIGNGGDGDQVATSSNYRSDFNIFFKDYITTAKIALGANSLKKAYYTIPDLRSSNLELGFSVNLSWQNGLVFDFEIQ